MTEFEKLLRESGEGENIEKYDDHPVPATPLQGRVRDMLKKGLERVSTEVKRDVIRHQRMRGMYSVLDRLGTHCSWDLIEQNGIFRVK